MPAAHEPLVDPKYAAMLKQALHVRDEWNRTIDALQHIESGDPKVKRRSLTKLLHSTPEIEARTAQYMTTVGRR
jgi:hypothetical protein